MTLIKLTIPKQNCTDNEYFSVEEDVVVIAPISSFYKVGNISRWVLNPHGLQFTTIGNDFSTLKLRKDNSSLELTLEVVFDTPITGEVAHTLKVASMEFVSELPHDVRPKLDQ